MINTFELKKIKLGFNFANDSAIYQHMVVSKFDDFINDQIRYYVDTFLWGLDNQRWEYKHPMTWWDAFKEKYFPAWLKNLFPVKYKYVILNYKVLLPNFSYMPEKLKDTLRMFSARGLEYSYKDSLNNKICPICSRKITVGDKGYEFCENCYLTTVSKG